MIVVAIDDDVLDESDIAEALRIRLPDEQVVRFDDVVDFAAVDIAVVAKPALGALTRFPNLRFVQSLWVGVNTLLAEAIPAHVLVARLVDSTMTSAMTLTVASHVLALHHGHHHYRLDQSRSLWRPLPPVDPEDRTVLVLGLGALGLPAATALASLGFAVLGWSRTPKTEAFVTFNGPDGLHDALAQAQIVVNLLPLTTQTIGILDASAFASLRPGAMLVNLGRGAHVDEGALLQALADGSLEHAVLDVFCSEPLPPESPFWASDQVTITPHVAAQTGRRGAIDQSVEGVLAFRARQPITGLVDRSAGY